MGHEKMIMLKGWQVPFRDYMTDLPVFPDDSNPWAAKVEAYADIYFADAFARNDEGILAGKPKIGPSDLYHHHLISSMPESVLMTHTGEICGGMMEFAPWILPEWRGRNLGAHLIADTEEAGFWMEIEGFSVSGFFARINAHGIHVRRAMLRGEDVPKEVIADYDSNGKLKILYSIEEHNKRKNNRRSFFDFS